VNNDRVLGLNIMCLNNTHQGASPTVKIELDGNLYLSSSAAASAVRGGAANGLEIWAVETGTGRTTLATLRAQLLEARKTQTSND
jgi:hypothetical protein